MKLNNKIQPVGFTLIEILLVIVIISALFYMSINYIQQKIQAERIDRTVLQMQQILNASMAYYLDQGKWPVDDTLSWSPTTILQDAGFLSPGVIANPWGPEPSRFTDHPTSYFLGTNDDKTRLSLLTYIGIGSQAVANAQVIAGKLPSAQTCSYYDKKSTTPCTPCGTSDCFVATTIPIPGQTLNNARAVNYAGLFHSGACVKAPKCPLATMVPSIIVVPVAVSGISTGYSCTDPSNLSTCTISPVPITNFTGYTSAPYLVPAGGTTPRPNSCSGVLNQPCTATSPPNVLISAKPGDIYWRVCIRVDTNQRVMPLSDSTWGQLMGTVMVLTRCVVQNENAPNSSFNIYAQ